MNQLVAPIIQIGGTAALDLDAVDSPYLLSDDTPRSLILSGSGTVALPGTITDGPEATAGDRFELATAPGSLVVVQIIPGPPLLALGANTLYVFVRVGGTWEILYSFNR